MGRRPRQGQIFHSIFIGLVSSVVEASLAIVTSQEFSEMLQLLFVASLSSQIFKDMDCVEIVLDVDKPLSAR